MDKSACLPLLPLPEHEVHVWYLFSDKIYDPKLLHSWRALLSPEEAARYERYAFARSREQFLSARALLRTTLSRYAQINPTDWAFAVNASGKPQIDMPAEFSALRFNISHTDGLVACAIARDHEVGVDVEDVGGREVTMDLARYSLSESELAHWEGAPTEARTEIFFIYWTLKEAYIKARGQAPTLQDFSFHLRPGQAPYISFAAGFDDDAQDWQFAQLLPNDRHRVAVAVRRPAGHDFELVVRETVPGV